MPLLAPFLYQVSPHWCRWMDGVRDGPNSYPLRRCAQTYARRAKPFWDTIPDFNIVKSRSRTNVLNPYFNSTCMTRLALPYTNPLRDYSHGHHRVSTTCNPFIAAWCCLLFLLSVYRNSSNSFSKPPIAFEFSDFFQNHLGLIRNSYAASPLDQSPLTHHRTVRAA